MCLLETTQVGLVRLFRRTVRKGAGEIDTGQCGILQSFDWQSGDPAFVSDFRLVDASRLEHVAFGAQQTFRRHSAGLSRARKNAPPKVGGLCLRIDTAAAIRAHEKGHVRVVFKTEHGAREVCLSSLHKPCARVPTPAL